MVRPGTHARCHWGAGRTGEKLEDAGQGVNRPDTSCPAPAGCRRIDDRGFTRGTRTRSGTASSIRNWKSKRLIGSGTRGTALYRRGAPGLGRAPTSNGAPMSIWHRTGRLRLECSPFAAIGTCRAVGSDDTAGVIARSLCDIRVTWRSICAIWRWRAGGSPRRCAVAFPGASARRQLSLPR